MLGLHNAAPSMAYSLVNVAPSNIVRASDSSACRIQPISQFARMLAESAHQVAVPPVETRNDIVQRRADVILVQGQDAPQHRARAGVVMFESLLPRDEQPGDDPR